MFVAPRSTRVLGTLAILALTGTLATRTVEIAPGDTLSQIAAANAVTVSDLVAWNDITDPDFIVAGETIVVEVESAGGAPATYVIETGDSLSLLARRFGSTVGALVAANDIADADHIVAGQILALSDGRASGSGPTTDGQSTSYVVKPGDTILAIARAYGLKTTRLVEVNAIADPDRIFVGQLLSIPPAGSTATDPPPVVDPPPTTTTTVPTTTTSSPRPAPGTGTALVGYFDKWSTVGYFDKWSTAYGIDQGLLEALLWVESGWRADAIGPSGSLGIGQLGPDTIEFVEQRLLGLDLDPLDASDGIQMAARFLRYLLDRTDNHRTALAAWNQGLHSVSTNGISVGGGTFADEVLAIRLQRS